MDEFIIMHDISLNKGYTHIPWDRSFALTYGGPDYVFSFYNDILELHNRRKTAFVMSYSAEIAPHEKNSYIRDELYNDTVAFALNKTDIAKRYRTDRSPELSPMKYCVMQSVTQRFLNNMHRTINDSDNRKYESFDLDINLFDAVCSTFDKDRCIIPMQDVLGTINGMLKKENIYSAYDNLKKATEFGQFDINELNRMTKSYALEAVRDISRIFQEYCIEQSDNDCHRDEVVCELRSEATITSSENIDAHIEKAGRNYYMAYVSDTYRNDIPDENHPRIDYIDLHKRVYYDEFILAYYLSLDHEAKRENFKEKLINNIENTDFAIVFRSNYGDDAIESLSFAANAEFAKIQNKIENSVETFDIGFNLPGPPQPK